MRITLALLLGISWASGFSQSITYSFTGEINNMFQLATDPKEKFKLTRNDFIGYAVFQYKSNDTTSLEKKPSLFSNTTEFLFIKIDSSLYFGGGKMERTGERWCTKNNDLSFSSIEYVYSPKGMKGKEMVYHFSPEFGLMDITESNGNVIYIFWVDQLIGKLDKGAYQCGKRLKKYSNLK